MGLNVQVRRDIVERKYKLADRSQQQTTPEIRDKRPAGTP
jgi:hypothetical protein